MSKCLSLILFTAGLLLQTAAYGKTFAEKFSIAQLDELETDDSFLDGESSDLNIDESYEDSSSGLIDEGYEEDVLSEESVFSDTTITESEVEEEINKLDAPAPVRIQPKDSNRFMYIKHPNQEKGLYKIASDGTYYYKYEESKRSYGVAAKMGLFRFNDLKNPDNGVAFSELYGTSEKPTIYFEYLWPFFKKKDVAPLLRAMRLKFGVGFLFANGNGRFARPEYAGIIPPEQFNFFSFPLSVGLQYAFEMYDKQILVPFGAAGLDYITGIEMQETDFGTAKYMGQLGAHLAGGVAISLSWLEQAASFELDKEFGINQTYLTIEARQNISIQQDFDFTSTSITAGLWLEF